MEFLTPEQKKHRSQRMFIGYGLFAVLISLATYILVSTALGFDILKPRGEVVQNGLLFIDSKPSGASIYVNGQLESQRTNTKLSLPEDVYDISLQRSGYREWRNKVWLFGGRVKFLTYPRLLPTVPQTVTSRSYSAQSPQITLQSHDKRWLVLYDTTNPDEWHIIDLENPLSDIVAFRLPDSLIGLGRTIINVELLDWASDDVHFLTKLQLDDESTRYVMVNRDKHTESVDLTGLLSIPASSLVYIWDGKWDRVVIVGEDGLTRLASVRDGSLPPSPLLADAVDQFFPLEGASAVYTTKISENETAVFLYRSDESYLIATYAQTDQQLDVKSARFNRNSYLLLQGGGLERALLYKNVIDGVRKSSTGTIPPFVSIPLRSTTIGFSTSGRFVMATDNQKIHVYDIEQREMHRYDLTVEKPVEVGWLDDSRLYALDSKSDLFVFDFNGSNNYELAKNVIRAPYVDKGVRYTALFTRNNVVQNIELKVVDILSETK